MKKIGIIGSGDVAKTLGSGFAKHGYEVMLGSRNPEKLAEWKAAEFGETYCGPAIPARRLAGTMREAAQFGEIVVLATHGSAAEEAIKQAGAENLSGKTVIDVTNPIDDSRPPVNGVLNYYTSLDESQMERLQKKFPSANFVKAFNSVGNAFMVNPDFGGEKPTMFICGNDDAAKRDVTAILEKFGWEAADMGKMEAARAIEPLCILWCIPGFLRNEWGHAFRLVKK